MPNKSRKPYRPPQLVKLGKADNIDIDALTPDRLRALLKLQAEHGTADEADYTSPPKAVKRKKGQ